MRMTRVSVALCVQSDSAVIEKLRKYSSELQQQLSDLRREKEHFKRWLDEKTREVRASGLR
jgi:hypothetical protein